MATFSDNTTLLTHEMPLTAVYDDDFLGPHLMLKLGPAIIQIALSPDELYATYKWTISQMHKLKQQQKTIGKKRK